MEHKKGRVFISYSRQDRLVAEELTTFLRGENFDVWVDFDSVSSGSVWRDEIRKGIQYADCFVILVSSDYLASEFCYLEYETSRIFSHACVIPVFLDDSWALLTESEKFADLLDNVCVDLRNNQLAGRAEARESLLAQIAKALRTPRHENRYAKRSDFVVCALAPDEEYTLMLRDELRARGHSAVSVYDQATTGERVSSFMYDVLDESTNCIFVLSAHAIRASSVVGRFALASEELRLPLLTVATPKLSMDITARGKVTTALQEMDKVFARIADRQLFLWDSDISAMCGSIIAVVKEEAATNRRQKDYPWSRMRGLLSALSRLRQ